MITGDKCEACVSGDCNGLVGGEWVWDGCVPHAWLCCTKLVWHGVCSWGGVRIQNSVVDGIQKIMVQNWLVH